MTDRGQLDLDATRFQRAPRAVLDALRRRVERLERRFDGDVTLAVAALVIANLQGGIR